MYCKCYITCISLSSMICWLTQPVIESARCGRRPPVDHAGCAHYGCVRGTNTNTSTYANDINTNTSTNTSTKY